MSFDAPCLSRYPLTNMRGVLKVPAGCLPLPQYLTLILTLDPDQGLDLGQGGQSQSNFALNCESVGLFLVQIS